MGSDADARLRRGQSGFSLIELMMAMTITLGMGLVVFQLFVQNEEVFRDQNLVLEMQQSARAVASMITDEVRMAGQGVPTYASSWDGNTWEGAQTFLNGTDSSTILFRANIRGATAVPLVPFDLTIGDSETINVDDVAAIEAIVGGNTNRFLYVWGTTTNDSWTWVRAQLTAINTGADQLTATPTQASGAGGTFTAVPYLALEEAIGYRLNGTAIERGESGDFTAMTAPVMTYSTMGENFTDLTFTYYDGSGVEVMPAGLADRASIRRVDFTLAAETSGPLASTGETETFAISMSIYPRNVSLY